jgi:3-deoxy-manno-octulosonate cytidylyltransferase (CMP-KDO synthetase)
MKKFDYLVIIPARYKSKRLEGKPLINLCGVPMVVRTYRQCIKVCSKDRIYVACDDDRIAEVCNDHGIQVIMTSTECLTGTDRVAECANQLDADVYINIQGDEPIFNPEDLKIFIDKIKQYPNEILNGVCEINDEELFRSNNVPKVVMREDMSLLYISRAAIPGSKNHEFGKSWRQVCIYAFPKKSLVAFRKKKIKTTLEQIEDIEILRFLELGWQVRMVPLSTQSVAVDTLDDVAKVEKIIKNGGF